MPTESTARLEAVLELFRRHDVEFIVIGGQAEVLMGSPRVTCDSDLAYRRTSENLKRLAYALGELKPTLRGVPPDLPFIIDERSLALGNIFMFDTPYGSIDLFSWVEPIGDYEAILKNAETHDLGGIPVKTIGLEDLIRVKKHVRRGKDQESLLQLLAIRKAREDTGLK
jgi:predicted nucleotidyltransferase